MNDQSPTPSSSVPPGWYPDPTAPGTGATRWWDGLSWSQEDVRPASAQAPVAPTQPPLANQAEDESNQTLALLATIAGAVLLLARIYFMKSASTAQVDEAYRSGSQVGNVAGAFLSAYLFAWGLTRYNGIEAAEPRHTKAIAVGSALAVLAIGWIIS